MFLEAKQASDHHWDVALQGTPAIVTGLGMVKAKLKFCHLGTNFTVTIWDKWTGEKDPNVDTHIVVPLLLTLMYNNTEGLI